MGQIFISHSSKDNEVSAKVRDWLQANGWQDVFLDLDPKQGLAPGQRWQDELRRAGERCSAVIVLISPDWVASKWCLTEFLLAVQLGKLIFPVFVRKTPFEDLPVELIAHFQLADISTPEAESDGFNRLLSGLHRAGLSPNYFPWPPANDPGRRPFPGLRALEEEDAAVLFGRDGQITRGMDAVRSLRAGAPERALVIIGASGVGKSSFLRAGLLARLARDELNFILVPVLRPANAAMSGDAGLFAALRKAHANQGGAPSDAALLIEHVKAKRWGDAMTALRAPSIARVQRAAQAAGQQAPSVVPPTIVFSIDQAEEALDGNAEAGDLAEAVRACVLADPQCIALFTVRSSGYSRLCAHPVLADVRHLPFNLPPMSSVDFKDVITGPAKLARPPVEFSDELVDLLISDLSSSDALPLLAFTLEQLYERFRNAGRPITVANYRDDLGGLGAIIAGAGLRALTAAAKGMGRGSRAELEQMLSLAFVPHLVTVDEVSREPQRRIARLKEIPAEAHPLVNQLVDARLLTLEERDIDGVATPVVQVAHEAIFRQWPDLEQVIAQHSEKLMRLSSLRRSAVEWQRNKEQPDWLEHQGERLRDALAIRDDKAFADAFTPDIQRYLAACEAAEEARLRAEHEQEERERQQIRRTRRFQMLASVLLLLFAGFLGAAGFGLVRAAEAQTSRSSAMLTRLAHDWAEQGYSDRAARFALMASQPPLPFLSLDTSEAETALARALQNQSVLLVLRGHEQLVNGARFSPSGALISTTAADGTLRLWDAATGREVREVHRQEAWMLSSAFSPDGALLAGGGEDGSVRVWDTESGALRFGPLQLPAAAAVVAFSPTGDGLAIGSYDGSVSIWSLAAPQEAPRRLEGHTDAVISVAYSPDGRIIASASGDESVILWDSATGNRITALTGHTGGVWALAFSRDGARLATGSGDRTAIVWDVARRENLLTLRGHQSDVTGIDFSPDGRFVATASQDGVARMFDSRFGQEVQRFVGHVGAANTIAFSPDGARVVTAGDDHQARVWHVSGDLIMAHHGASHWVDESPDGRSWALASADGAVYFHDGSNGRELESFASPSRSVVLAVAFAPSGQQLALATIDRNVLVWRRGASAPSWRVSAESDVRALAYAPNGAVFATASADGTIRLFDAATGVIRNRIRHSANGAAAVSFSPDGRLIATGGGDSVIRLWSAETLEPAGELTGHDAPVNDLRFGANNRLVSASIDNTARLWDVAGGTAIATFTGHAGEVTTADLSGNGRLVVTASADRTVRVWDVETQGEILRFSDYSQRVRQARFTGDGAGVLTVSFDGVIRRRLLADYRDDAISARRRSALLGYACERYMSGGRDVMDEYEQENIGRLTANRSSSVCARSGVAQYAAYAFGLH